MTTGDAFDDLASDASLESVFGAAREDRRAEEEEYTRAAARQWARHRDLVDVVRQLQHRGDTLSMQVGDLIFIGVLDVVGDDYVQLGTDGGRVDIPLLTSRDQRDPRPVLVRVVERARAGGRRTRPSAQTFRARLIEYDGEEIEAVVGTTGHEQLRGRIVVGRDHVVIRDRDDGETYVPLSCVAWVRPWRE